MGDSNSKLQALTNRVEDRAGTYGMEINTEKSKVMVNSIKNISANNERRDSGGSRKLKVGSYAV